MNKQKIVIVGGGFAGIHLAKKLAGSEHYDVTLVDKNNYNFFPPLIYQVSTAFIEPSNISYPFRRMFQRKANLRFHYGSLVRIHTAANTIETDVATLEYDRLVLAMGCETNYFGMQDVREKSLPLKNIDDALNLRNHLLLTVERLINSKDESEKVMLRNIVIAGGGPTGVEVAGMLAEMRRNIVKKDYPELTARTGKIYLVDAGPSLLGPMSKKAQEEAFRVLKGFGVEVLLNTAVKGFDGEKVQLATGQELQTNTLIWASGVIAREAPGLAAESIGRGRRILVNEHNLVNGTTNVYAIGDICYQTTDPGFPNGHPQVAQVAIQQGIQLAQNFEREAKNAALKPFRYKDKGSMAIIAKYKAVVDLPKVFFKGFFAWLTWLFIHIIPIAGFRNKMKLAFSWMWSFLTNDPTLRLVIRPGKEQHGERPPRELSDVPLIPKKSQ